MGTLSLALHVLGLTMVILVVIKAYLRGQVAALDRVQRELKERSAERTVERLKKLAQNTAAASRTVGDQP